MKSCGLITTVVVKILAPNFWGKGYLKLKFDRIGLPSGDLPLEAKVISTRGYKVDKEGKIDGKGHPKRDVVEWMLPPLFLFFFIKPPTPELPPLPQHDAFLI